MLTLDKVIAYIDPEILEALCINQADEIIQYALVLHLHNKDKCYLEKYFWKELNPGGKVGDRLTVLEHAVNRFTAEFIQEFCNGDGSINWEKLVKFNSGVKGE
jgi:hypothetical protein